MNVLYYAQELWRQDRKGEIMSVISLTDKRGQRIKIEPTEGSVHIEVTGQLGCGSCRFSSYEAHKVAKAISMMADLAEKGKD